MKKHLILAFFLFYSIILFGQEKISFGVKGGMNYSKNVLVGINNANEYNQNNKFRLAYHAGIYTEIKIKGKLSLITEVLFSSKGFIHNEIPGSNSTPGGDAKLHFNYLSVPALISYSLGPLKLGLGPEFSYLISAKSKFESETFNVNYIWDNKYDFGLAAGFGFRLSEKLQTEIRYTHGFSSVIKDVLLTDDAGNEIGTADTKYQNRCFQVSLAYRLLSK